MIAILNVQAQQPLSFSTSGGTLIVAVPTRDGLVVCADKRFHNKKNGGPYSEAMESNDDNNIKVQKLGDKVLFAIAGLTKYEEEGQLILTPQVSGLLISGNTLSLAPTVNSAPSFTVLRTVKNLNGVIRDFYQSKDLNHIENTWRDLIWELKRNIAPIENKADNKDLIFEMRIFYMDTAGNIKSQLFFGTKHLTGTYEVFTKPDPEFSYDLARPVVYGNPELFEVIKKDINDDFNHLRDEPVLIPFLSTPWARDDVSKQMAIAFGKTLIEATHRYGKRLGSGIEVSLECDCMLVQPGIGVREITADDEIVSPQQPAVQKRKKKN